MSRMKKTFLVLAMAGAMLAAFFSGGYYGFFQGYAYRVYHASSTSAYETVRELEDAHAGDLGSVKAQLEMRLDSHIIEHGSGLGSGPLISFNPLPRDEDSTRKLMGKVAAYRKAHPTGTAGPVVRKSIDSVVERYADAD